MVYNIVYLNELRHKILAVGRWVRSSASQATRRLGSAPLRCVSVLAAVAAQHGARHPWSQSDGFVSGEDAVWYGVPDEQEPDAVVPSSVRWS